MKNKCGANTTATQNLSPIHQKLSQTYFFGAIETTTRKTNAKKMCHRRVKNTLFQHRSAQLPLLFLQVSSMSFILCTWEKWRKRSGEPALAWFIHLWNKALGGHTNQGLTMVNNGIGCLFPLEFNCHQSKYVKCQNHQS